MKKVFFSCIVLIAMSVIAYSNEADKRKPVRVELLSSSWLFNFALPAQSVLTSQIQQDELAPPDDIEQGFTIKFLLEIKNFDDDVTILEIPEVVNVRLRQHDVQDRRWQNYPAFKMSDGSTPVLEASVTLHLPVEKREIKDMTVGIPLAMLDQPIGKHEVILNFSGVQWTMYVDGKLLDNDFAFGYPQWSGKRSWKLNPVYVGKAEIYMPALKAERLITQEPETVPEIQYWTPHGHNAWVGDVVTFYHEGRYHVFYLYDRRHHTGKFGHGGHYFEHLSTKDFKTWTEHQAAVPIDEQWETIGTGTPFVVDGKFCISYGFHTTRFYPKELTTLPEQWAYLEKHGYTGSFHRDDTKGFPAGSTYSVSADGISQFKKTGIMFHPCENPGIYIDSEGKIKMLSSYAAKGTWESESIDGGWRCIDPEFPPGGDCTFYFRWGNFDYVIGGFKNLWSRPVDEPHSKYTDVVQQGLDFYNGLNVPAVTEIFDGRFLMAGWIGILRWGGPLIIHEMIQFPDGRIGTKWMEEITPETKSPKILSKKISETTTFPVKNESFMLTFRVRPTNKEGKFGVVFLNEDGEQNSCEWQIRPDDLLAQFANGSLTSFSESQKSLRQGGSPQNVRNYAIENLIGVDKDFTVRLIVKGCGKLGGSIIDVEIAGKRTMIAYRPNLLVKKLLFRTDGIEIQDVKIAPLVN